MYGAWLSVVPSGPEDCGIGLGDEQVTKIIVSLSGGMDSATVLGLAISQGHEVHAVGFTYGSKHNQYENEAAANLAEFYKVSYQLVDLSSVMEAFKSDLLKTGGDIPEGHYEEDSMPRTVVPSRNIIFASILSGLAWSIEAQEVWLGIQSDQDGNSIYPDCRPGFYRAMREAIIEGTGGRVELLSPFLLLDKAGIIRKGIEIGVPFSLTRTCYKDQPVSCGQCGACQKRLQAFKNSGLEDPIQYETR